MHDMQDDISKFLPPGFKLPAEEEEEVEVGPTAGAVLMVVVVSSSACVAWT